MVVAANHIKCVVIGDDSVGKTSLLVSYATRRFPTNFVPTAFDNYAGTIHLSGKPHQLELLDTIEQEASTNTIQTTFSDTDVFVICYSSVQPKSFKNVKEKWLPRIRDYLGDIPLVLVATQTDLRNNASVVRKLKKDGLKPVSREEGTAFSKRINSACYVETSPDMERRMKTVMNKAISSVLLPPSDRTEIMSCNIL